MKFFLSIISLIFKKGKISEKNHTFKEEQYLGIDNNQVPMRIYYSKKYTHKTIIIFLGASPDGEKHKSLNFLAKALTQFGYNVFVPRIPPLMQLDISNKNVDWMTHIYSLIESRDDVNSKYITAVGISYGGGMLLKACLDSKLVKNPPKSILLYGAGCNADTILKFITKGEFKYNGELSRIEPHVWGLTVFFHHFIDDIDFGFDKNNIKRIIQLRINNEKEESHKQLKLLNNPEYKIADSIISGKIIPEVQLLVDQLMIEKSAYITDLSCKPICNQIALKTFIFHGANDNMIPFTESVQLNKLIPDSSLLVSYLFGHKGLSGRSNILFKVKEAFRMLKFFYQFDKHNAS